MSEVSLYPLEQPGVVRRFSRGREPPTERQLIEIHTSFERVWHMKDSQGQILALTSG